MLERFTATDSELHLIESKVAEIQRLQNVFSEKVFFSKKYFKKIFLKIDLWARTKYWFNPFKDYLHFG